MYQHSCVYLRPETETRWVKLTLCMELNWLLLRGRLFCVERVGFVSRCFWKSPPVGQVYVGWFVAIIHQISAVPNLLLWLWTWGNPSCSEIKAEQQATKQFRQGNPLFTSDRQVFWGNVERERTSFHILHIINVGSNRITNFIVICNCHCLLSVNFYVFD